MAEKRRSKRFELSLPVELVRAGSVRLSLAGETKNVSSTGVLFTTDEFQPEVGQSIEYLISLPTGSRIGEVRLRCMGKVVRRDVLNHAVAATLERYEFVRTAAAAR